METRSNHILVGGVVLALLVAIVVFIIWLMQAGGKLGMVTMDMSLAKALRAHQISVDVAREYCANDEDLRRLMGA